MKRNTADANLKTPSNKKTKVVSYYINNSIWKNSTFQCDRCNWQGLGKDARMGNVFTELFELDCPKCNKERIAIIGFPTTAEIRKYGNETEKQNLTQTEKFLQKVEMMKLKSVDDIIDIEDDDIVITWDHEKTYTVIKHNDKVIWKEIALYEGYERYLEVGELLKQKYGTKLKDFIPTERSELYLYGDRFCSVNEVKKFRKSLTKN